MTTLTLILLLAFDLPLSQGVATFTSRFDGPNQLPIPAVFLTSRDAEAPALEWFLDGDGILAPLAASHFVETGRVDGDPAGLLRGQYLLGFPDVSKPTFLRGVIHTDPPQTVRLLLFPRSELTRRWEAVGRKNLPITLVGKLTGLRDLLESHAIAVREADQPSPDSVDRNGLLIAGIDSNAPGIPPGLAKGTILFVAGSGFGRRFLEHSNGDVLVMESTAPDFPNNPLAQQLILQLAERIHQP